MGITLIIVMGMLAFIVNVGLFVKAKINLQNATDAAAFAGAATQARQLTNIAYANWELRNTYKEWMFKYYVLGQLGLVPYNLHDTNLAGKNKVNFILQKARIGAGADISGVTDFDKYNIPSICVHNNSGTNICPIYALPGIPRFPAIGVAGISEIHEAFVNKLGATKAEDCSRRSKLNFLTALTWAYGSGGAPMPEAPVVATQRPGAWPQALELAFRIRNLEMIMNRPPINEISIQNVTQFQGQFDDIGLNERPLKAFWSAYRNLGGGTYKDAITGTGQSFDELPKNLKLTELPPQPYTADTNSVSGFLIPPGFVYPGASSSALQKHYVDLQLMPLNLATMFSVMVSTSNQNAVLDVKMDATCGISKAALPVPGYILGFNKNPEVITYYAVKAESRFIGLFFPITTGDSAQEGVKLTAYAAAKPFGGRIGPKLFNFIDGDKTVVARGDVNLRSGSYMNGLSVEVTAAAGFKPGMPIPSSSDFWVNITNPVIGGVPGTATRIFYGIPNMIYDFQDEGDLNTQRGTGELQMITPLLFDGDAPTQTLGLYHAPQFKALKESVGILNPGTEISGDEVFKSLIRSRRPTKYDAINYLIPDFREVDDKNNAAPMVQRLQAIGSVGFTYKLFAPLVGPSLLYKTNNDVESVVTTYMTANDPAIDTYLKALLAVSNSILGTATGGSDLTDAAKSIHANAGTGNPTPPDFPDAPATDPGCRVDMASKFHHFFRSNTTRCDIVPLKKLMVDFIAAHSSNIDGLDQSYFYIGEYYNEPANTNLAMKPEQLMTAYFPGPRQGTNPGNAAIAEHPLKLSVPGTSSYSTRRNYYSTKFFQMAKIIDSPPGGTQFTRGRIDYEDQPALKESMADSTSADLSSLKIKNFLKFDAATGINNNYFLDF
jgi:hypothetical protein